MAAASHLLSVCMLPGASALTRTGLAPARTTRLSGRTTPPMYHAPRNRLAVALQFDFVLKQRLEAVEERIHSACQRSGRNRSDITLIAVTKVFPATVVREAYDIGLRDFGENYVQEFADKLPQLGPMPEGRFHLIGHLQSNKAKPAAEIFQIIQTVDSPETRATSRCRR